MVHGILIVHQRTTQFDDGGLSSKASNPAHGFDERVGLGNCVVHVGSFYVYVK